LISFYQNFSKNGSVVYIYFLSIHSDSDTADSTQRHAVVRRFRDGAMDGAAKRRFADTILQGTISGTQSEDKRQTGKVDDVQHRNTESRAVFRGD